MICALKDRYLYLLMTLWIPWFFTPVRFTRFFSPGIYFSVYIDNYKFNSGAFYLAREPFFGLQTEGIFEQVFSRAGPLVICP